MSGEILDCHHWRGARGTTCIQWVEAEMLVSIPKCPGWPPATNDEPAPNVHSAEDEKLVPHTLECSRTQAHPFSQRKPI